MEIDERVMEQALELARTAESHGDVPVAAIILKDGEIIGQSEPRVMVDCDPTAHAELLGHTERRGQYREPVPGRMHDVCDLRVLPHVLRGDHELGVRDSDCRWKVRGREPDIR